MTMKNQNSRQWLASTFLLLIQIDELCHSKLMTVEEWVFASDAKTLVQLQPRKLIQSMYNSTEPLNKNKCKFNIEV